MSPRKKARKKAKRILRVSVPMLNQMLSYCDWQEMEGSYYGIKEHFQKRHKRIVAWLEAIRDKRLGARIPPSEMTPMHAREVSAESTQPPDAGRKG